MKLFINEIEVNFSLEHEKTLEDLYSSLSELLKKEGAVLFSIKVNQDTIELEDAKTSKMTIAQIDILKIEAIPRQEMLKQSRAVISDFLESLLDLCKTSTQVPQNLETEYKKIKTTIDSFFFVDIQHTVLSNFFELAWALAGFSVMTKNELQVNTDLAVKIFEILLVLLERQKISDETQGAESGEQDMALFLLQSFISLFKEIPTLLYKQYHGLVLHLIFTFSEAFKIFVHYAEKSMANQKLALITNITEYLSTINDAIEAKDWITIGDVCEYELLPLLQTSKE